MDFSLFELIVCVLLLFIIVGALGCAVYIKLRPRYPAHVECWFCGEKSTVPYDNRNCWDCPGCGQYNGFAEDGDYNKPIPAQFTEEFNHPVTGFRDEDEELEYPVSPPTSPTALCETCSRNQALKIRRLAEFVPFDETHYEAEVEAYRRHLEYIHRLCRSCERLTQCELNRQDTVLADMMEEHYYQERLRNRRTSGDNLNLSLHPQPLAIPVQSLYLLATLSAVCLGMADLQFLHPGIDFPAPFDRTLVLIHTYSLGLVLVGVVSLLAGIFIAGRDRLLMRDGLACVVWAILVFHCVNCYVGLVPQQDISTRHTLGLLLNGVAMAATIFMAFWPRYFISRRISLIRKRMSTSRLSSSSGSPSPRLRRTQPALASANRSNEHSRTSSDFQQGEVSMPARNPREPSIPRIHSLRIGTPPRERGNNSGIFSPFGGRQSPIFGGPSMSLGESVASFHSVPSSQSLSRLPSFSSLHSAASGVSHQSSLRSDLKRPLIHPSRFTISDVSSLNGRTIISDGLSSVGRVMHMIPPGVVDDDSDKITSASTNGTHSSSVCPVGSTTKEPEQTLPGKDWSGLLGKKTFWQCILGVSLGLNLTYLGFNVWSHAQEWLA